MHLTKEKLHHILTDAGIVAESDLLVAEEESERFGQPITTVLVSRGLTTEQYVMEILAGYMGVPTIDLRRVTIPPETLEAIPEGYAKSKEVILFDFNRESGIAKVAMIDPLDLSTIEYLRAKLGAWIEPHLTTSASLGYGIKQYKKKISDEFSKIINDNIQKTVSAGGGENLGALAETVPIVTILDSIIEHAVVLGASDIHFEPFENDVLIRYRIDGILQEILNLPKTIEPILVARVKILANLQIDEHRTPQDGRFRFEMEGGDIDVRVNVMPVFHGEKVEMRLLRSSLRTSKLADLGMSTDTLDIVLDEIKKTHGMILVTGPTGHGKTTTLYTILHLLNTPKVNITTIEDPIEYDVPRINQTQVNVKAGITFGNGLRALLRQNPDIIMVGEIRDEETVDISVHAALTGHLVLSTLHTNDAPAAVPRLIDMGAPAFLLASSLNVVIAQRLVRKICASCVTSYIMTKEIKKVILAQIMATGKVDKPPDIPERLYRGTGCAVCNNSGFHGQTGIFEVMRVTKPASTLIDKQAAGDALRAQAILDGMRTLFEDGLEKVQKGVTTIEEVLRVSYE